MDTRISEPCKEEESYCGAEACDKCRAEPKFLRAHAVAQNIRDEVKVEVGEVNSHGDDAAHYYACEDEAGFANVETVHYWVN